LFTIHKKSSIVQSLIVYAAIHYTALTNDHNTCHLFKYMFQCDKWLVVDKGDHRIRRSVNASQGYTHPDTSDLMRRNMSQRIVDDHMWLSVGYRAQKSRFTRAQRLGACMATLFLAMISNCVFFKDASEQTSTAPLISMGPVSITGTQIYNSFMSTLIVFPPILVIKLLFSKSSPKTVKRQSVNRNNSNNNSSVNKHKGQWPYRCAYIGWTLVFLAILVSAIFTILYSIQWGKAKSTDWLIAFILSFVESAVLI